MWIKIQRAWPKMIMPKHELISCDCHSHFQNGVATNTKLKEQVVRLGGRLWFGRLGAFWIWCGGSGHPSRQSDTRPDWFLRYKAVRQRGRQHRPIKAPIIFPRICEICDAEIGLGRSGEPRMMSSPDLFADIQRDLFIMSLPYRYRGSAFRPLLQTRRQSPSRNHRWYMMNS